MNIVFDSGWSAGSVSRVALLALALAWTAACGGAPPGRAAQMALITEEGEIVQGGGGGAENGGVTIPVCKTVTVSGQIFYNDQRQYGRFPMRYAASIGGAAQQRGTQYKLAADPDNNYLGLFEATVKVYEVDPLYGDPQCSQSELVGQTSIDAHGSFSWVGEVCDPCTYDDVYETDADDAAGVSVAVKIELRQCDDAEQRCFRVVDPAEADHPLRKESSTDGTLYARWHRAAGLTNPAVVHGSALALGRDDFEETANDSDDNDAQAANVFASLVDVTRKVHRAHGIPFEFDRYGEVYARYPATYVSLGAHAHESAMICISKPKGDPVVVLAPQTFDPKTGEPSVEVETPMTITPTLWYNGFLLMHEYGHLVMYRAWDGQGSNVNYCFGEEEATGCGESQGDDEYYATALKEGWAEFIQNVTLNDVDPGTETENAIGCQYQTEAPVNCPGPLPCAQGDRVATNVMKALCDWYDVADDNTPICKARDHFGSQDLLGIWLELRDAWSAARASQRGAYDWVLHPAGAADNGLRLCDLAAHFIDVTHGGDGVIRDNVSDFLENAGIDCALRLVPKSC